MHKKKLIRITTVPISLEKLLESQLTFMNGHYEVIAVSSEEEKLAKFGKDNGVRTQYIELTRQITIIKDLKALWKMYRFLKKEKPFIVHSHTPKAGTIGMLASKFARVPNRLHTVAGLPLLEATGLKRRILNFVEKITYKAATKVYPNSFGLMEIIIQEKFCSVDKLNVIANGSSNGIDTSFFNPALFDEQKKREFRNSLNIDENDFVFVFIGRLVADKGINELVTAFDTISKSDQTIKLLLVGPKEPELDPLKPETESLINVNKHIIITGFQSDVRPYLAISNVLTFPSYREGFPNVVMQAGAMGLPSIVSDINGCNEIIEEGINGLFIPPKDSMALQNAMIRLLEDKNVYKNLKNNARQMITSRYEQKLVWEALLSEYQDLLVGSKI